MAEAKGLFDSMFSNKSEKPLDKIPMGKVTKKPKVSSTGSVSSSERKSTYKDEEAMDLSTLEGADVDESGDITYPSVVGQGVGSSKEPNSSLVPGILPESFVGEPSEAQRSPAEKIQSEPNQIAAIENIKKDPALLQQTKESFEQLTGTEPGKVSDEMFLKGLTGAQRNIAGKMALDQEEEEIIADQKTDFLSGIWSSPEIYQLLGTGLTGAIDTSAGAKMGALSVERLKEHRADLQEDEALGMKQLKAASERDFKELKHVREREDKLRQGRESRQQVKDYQKVRDSYRRILASAKDSTAAGDLAIIFNYMKMLDPGSVVRESEFRAAEMSQGAIERFRNFFTKLSTGKRFGKDINEKAREFLSNLKEQGKPLPQEDTPEWEKMMNSLKGFREDMVDRAGMLMEAQRGGIDRLDRNLATIAKKQKLDIGNIILDIDIPEEMSVMQMETLTRAGHEFSPEEMESYLNSPVRHPDLYRQMQRYKSKTGKDMGKAKRDQINRILKERELEKLQGELDAK